MRKSAFLFILLLILLTIQIVLTQESIMTNAGEISSINQYKNIAYIDIKNDPTTYVIFTSKILPLKKGENIKFEGKIEEYKGEKQFIILEIKKNI